MQPAPPALTGLVPVQATLEVVTTWPKGGSNFTALFMRDEMARTRIEQPGGVVSVSDPVAGKSFTLNPATMIAIPGMPHAPGLPPVPGMPAAPAIPGAPKPPMTLPAMPQLTQTADLGKKVMAGIPVQGKQFTVPPMPPIPGMPKPPAPPAAPAVPGAPGMPAAPAMPAAPGMPPPPAMPAAPVIPKPPVTAEIWTAHEMKLPMHSTVIDPSLGLTTVTQMKNVVFGAKIDPAKFAIPPGYKIIVTPPKPPVFGVAITPPAPPTPPKPPVLGIKV